MLPPPPPPAPGQKSMTLNPLLEGTLVEIDGQNIRLQNNGTIPPPPPSPPTPSSRPAAPHVIGAGAVPQAPPAPPASPAPSEFVDEMIQAGATFFLNGKKISHQEAQKITARHNFNASIRTKKIGGQYQVHMKQ